MKFLLSVIFFLMFSTSVAAQSDRSNIWVMWERIFPDASCQGAQNCPDKDQFTSHIMLNLHSQDAQQLFKSLEPIAAKNGSANIAHETSPICLGDVAMGPTDNEIVALPMADKITTLRGLNGIYVDLRAIIGPAGYKGSFGQEAHEFLTEQFSKAGIPILDRETVEITPGNPELSMRYSPEIQGCRPWSVSLSLKQTLLLSRDLTLKTSGSTWSASSRQDESDIDYAADDAMRDVIKIFVSDYVVANDPSYEPPVAAK